MSSTSASAKTQEQDSFGSKFHVAIIGAGIVGLALASFLRQSSFPVTVLEADEELKEIGAGIELGVNACRVLHQLGVLNKVKQEAVHTTRLVLHSYRDGRPLSILDLVPHIEEEYGFPCLSIHRADLRRVLFDEAQARGADIQFSRKIDPQKSNFGKGVVGGPDFRVSADLVVAADGQHSQARAFLLGKPNAPSLTGKAVTRVLVDVQTLVQAGRADLLDEFHAWLGPESMAVGYTLRNVFNVALAHSSPEKVASLGPRVVEKPYVRDLVSDWDESFTQIVELAQGFQEWPLLAPSESPSSWKDASSKLVLTGDAAHACLPYLAQGAAMGLESACALSRLLSKATRLADIHSILELYENVRRPRTDQVIQATLNTGDMWMMPNGPDQIQRDHRFGSEKPPLPGFPNPYLDPGFRPWLWEYDALRAADEAWNTSNSR